MAYEVTSDLDQLETSLIANLYPHLRAFASVVAPAQEDPNDLVQEALLRTLRTGPLSALDCPKAYLRTVIYHLAVSARRHWAAQSRALVRIPADVEMPEDPWQVEELLRLPPKARAVLYLQVIEGLPFEAIGDMLGCSAASARKAASRAMPRLRRLFQEEAGDARA